MRWSYRVVKREFGEGLGCAYFIAEVYYNDKDEITFYVVNDANEIKEMAAWGQDSLDELRGDLENMLAALTMPVLDYDELQNLVMK